MSPDTTLFLGLLALTIILAYVMYRIGQREGAASERIKLYGNTLPRYENPPPMPEKLIKLLQKRYCWEIDCEREALWKVQPDMDSEDFIHCCSHHMNGWVDKLEGKPYLITRIQEEQEKDNSVPAMPNHPPLPQHVLDARAYAADFLNQHPQATREQAYESGYLLAIRIAQAAGRIAKAKDQFEEAIKHRNVGNYQPEVTQDQLIDALMDMRLENFLCAHTIPAHAGTDLYYFSRKETAEYLLDMYTITPKAKH